MSEKRRALDESPAGILDHRAASPSLPCRRRQRLAGSANPEQIKSEHLRVAVPAIWNKPRFRTPAVRKSGSAVESPAPVDSRIDRIHECAHFAIVKIFPCAQCALQKQRGIDCR